MSIKGKNIRERQFIANAAWVMGGYFNGQLDYGKEEYPDMTAEQWYDFIVPEVYNIKVVRGCQFGWDGCCDDLRFIGKKRMMELVAALADEDDMLV